MSARGVVVRAVLLALSVVLAWSVLPAASQAQTNGVSYSYKALMSTRSIAVGAMDSSTFVSMVGYRKVTIRVKLHPPSGAAEPWAIGALSMVGSLKAQPDTTTTGIVALQPSADRSYIGSAAGDSTSFGAYYTATATTLGHGEVQIGGRRYNSSFPYPSADIFVYANKGNQPSIAGFWLRARSTAAGGAGSPRWSISILLEN